MERFNKPSLPLLSECPTTPVNKLMQEYMAAWSSSDGMMPLARSRVIAESHANTAANPVDKAKAYIDVAVIDLSQARVMERNERYEDAMTPGPCYFEPESQRFEKEATEYLKKATKLAPAVTEAVLLRSLQGR
ncbi:MAG TPA: hypothetical protein V6C86_03555 [Oculatellaceae cyanobacterium]